MKKFKKLFVCLLAVTVLYSSQLTYVNAATIQEAEPTAADWTTVNFSATNEEYDITVTFIFSYSDGNDVNLVAAVPALVYPGYNFSTQTTYNGEIRYVTVTAINGMNVAVIKVWCDIYGQYGQIQ